MADFTIKPASGTGNKLILQTQDETAVLTTSDTGVTIASPTITGEIGGDIITSTTGKIKQKGSAFQSHITASLALGY
jgi:hypothetical protein